MTDSAAPTPVTLETSRLLLRPYTPGDVDVLTALRNDPEVARYQSWSTPYPVEKSVEMIEDFVRLGGVTRGDWYHFAVEDRATGEFIGDLPIGVHADFPVAEVGYSFVRSWQGRGLATEAMVRLIDWLFAEFGLRRLEAYLHPDNLPSARLLERLGFLYEGTKRLAFGTDDDPSDDPVYGLLLPDWDAWKSRLHTPPAEVSLVEVTPANLGQAAGVTLHRSQERDLPRAADALLQAVVAGRWHRAVEADGVVVGVVVADPSDPAAAPLLILDRMHQERGIAERLPAMLPSQD